jgi:hypothetical protein
MRWGRVPVTAAAIAAVSTVAACGGGGDSATFELKGARVDVTESGRAGVQVDGAPEMDYNGPVGCRGRYFTTEYPEGVQLAFRYSAHDAYLLQGSSLYHLGPPTQAGATLRWSETVGGGQLRVQVRCPLPPGALPAISALAPPSACSLLTRALVVSLLGPHPGRPDSRALDPLESHCAYSTSDLHVVTLDVEGAQLLKSELLWKTRTVTALGVPAHYPGGPQGLVFVKGKLGADVTVISGDATKDLADDERIARAILPKLPG